MAVTITAYQGLGGPIRLTRSRDNPRHDGDQYEWNPSNDMIRDSSRDNICLLSWMVRTASFTEQGLGDNVRIEILFDGEETKMIENIQLPNGKIAQTINTGFWSRRASLNRNRIVFNFAAGFGDILISDCVVFYKRRVEGV